MKNKFLRVIALSLAVAVGLLAFCSCNDKDEILPNEEAKLALNRTDIELSMGEEFALTVSGAETASWKTDDASVAEVSGSGIVKAVANGYANITATADATELICSVHVTEFPKGKDKLVLSSAAITNASGNIYEKEKVSVTAMLYLDGVRTSLIGAVLEWITDDATVVKINSEEDGVAMLEGLKAGSAKISSKVTLSEKTYESAEYSVEVTAFSRIRADKEDLTLLAPEKIGGGAVTANRSDDVVIYRAEGNSENVVNSSEITWSSSDNTVATVSGGTVTALKNGNTTVTARVGDASLDIDVTVYTPIYTTADMDYLALVTYNKTKAEAEKALSMNYILMNNLDYGAQTRNFILPIAALSGDGYSELFASLGGAADVSFFSFGWEKILNLTRSERKGCNVMMRNANTEFAGINPEGVAFTGILDGNGYAIKNAWLMNDNVLFYAGKTFTTGVQCFIGKNEGTVRNLCFDNLWIGDHEMMEKDLHYEYFKNSSQLYAAAKPDSLSYRYAQNNLLFISHKGYTGKDSTRVFYGGRVSNCNGLILNNIGSIENLEMNYTTTASAFNTTMGSGGVTAYNASSGVVENCVLTLNLDEYHEPGVTNDMIEGNPASILSKGRICNVYVCAKRSQLTTYIAIGKDMGSTFNLSAFYSRSELLVDSANMSVFRPTVWNRTDGELRNNIYAIG